MIVAALMCRGSLAGIVEGMNSDFPAILFTLLRRQFTAQSSGVS